MVTSSLGEANVPKYPKGSLQAFPTISAVIPGYCHECNARGKYEVIVETLKDKVEEGYDVWGGVPGHVRAEVGQVHVSVMTRDGDSKVQDVGFNGVPEQIQEIDFP